MHNIQLSTLEHSKLKQNGRISVWNPIQSIR